MKEILRQLPKVDQLLDEPEIRALIGPMPRSLVVKAVRQVVDDLRRSILDGTNRPGPETFSRPAILKEIVALSEKLNRPRFRRVVNGTGVIVHTNLGRSLMAEEALEAIEQAGRCFNNLEFNLETGRRGSRYSHVEELLCELTGAEAGLVVNNNAAAVMIALETMARGREVIVSRGELVEIGGAFRIPDVMARSGAVLVEVGTTNKTHLDDYERAMGENTAMLMKVHQSNFQIIGFSSMVDIGDVVELAHSKGLPAMEDLGSGTLVDLSRFGLRKEPTVQETVAAGMDVTTFSGDKLLGGPQAGIILGNKTFIDRIKKNPTNRAMRIDKFTLSALEATLRLYLDEATALKKIPTLRMIAMSYQTLWHRATLLKQLIEPTVENRIQVGLRDGFSRVGGGAMPEEGLKTSLVTLEPLEMSVNHLEEKLRNQETPIIGRIENDRFLLDPRTMSDEDFAIVKTVLEQI